MQQCSPKGKVDASFDIMYVGYNFGVQLWSILCMQINPYTENAERGSTVKFREYFQFRSQIFDEHLSYHFACRKSLFSGQIRSFIL